MKKSFVVVFCLLLLLSISGCRKKKPVVQGKTVSVVQEKDELQRKEKDQEKQLETLEKIGLEEIDYILDLTKRDVEERVGKDYEVVGTGAEGACDGYYYRRLGITVSFGAEQEEVNWIDCDETFDIKGVHAGMDFMQIREVLGEGKPDETWMETPDYPVYMVEYEIGNLRVTFWSYSKEGIDSFARIERL